ncbi:MAG: hypothetical protein M3281_04765 [Chloroflexota bacterium]|nr:hypothetical protein [Chloroflexota bacterium]
MEVTAATPYRELSLTFAFGLDETAVQRLPFQRRMSVRLIPLESVLYPTAQAELEEAAATAYSVLKPDTGFGLDTLVQLVPFHRRMRVLNAPVVASLYQPTAHALVAEIAEIDRRELKPEPTLGLGTLDQAVPFHLRIKVFFWPVLTSLYSPTAQALFVAVASTS